MLSKLIFVTGAAGYLGSHIVHILLQNGYRVRAAARGPKVDLLRKGYASYKDQLEVVEVTDISASDLTGALEGVYAVIHTASPLPNEGSPETILNGAVEGTLNVIRQAQKVGIKRIVATSSIVAAIGTGWTLTDQDWNPITREDALKGSAIAVYIASKTLAEQAIWEFADAHRDIDVTTFNPPFLYGPLSPGMIIPYPDYGALSTSLNIYRLLKPDGVFPSAPGYSDVRDVARAHVAALHSPLEAAVGRKRLLIASPFDLHPKEVVELIAAKRPELKERLIDLSGAPDYSGVYKITVDLKRVEDVVGVRADSYYPWQDTILDTVDASIALEKKWRSEGYTVVAPNE